MKIRKFQQPLTILLFIVKLYNMESDMNTWNQGFKPHTSVNVTDSIKIKAFLEDGKAVKNDKHFNNLFEKPSEKVSETSKFSLTRLIHYDIVSVYSFI